MHCFFEGYFIIHHDHMASAQDFFGQLWKEYSLSDSRYMTSDTLVLCLETMTVVRVMILTTQTRISDPRRLTMVNSSSGAHCASL